MKERDEVALRGARTWLDVAALSGATDRELLDQFAAGDGHTAQVAFAALVARHGPMVLRTCRATLRGGHAAEDAFQATFLVLVRRGGTLWVRESLGPWLHRVAARVAIRAQAAAARRKRHERQAARARAEAREGRDPEDVGPIIHAEIDRLPACYRAPVVLCDLEGRTHEEAAAELGCPVGTVKSRLTRARARLKARLTRRGVLPAAGGLGTLLAGQPAAAVTSRLVLATAEAANRFAASGEPVAGSVPATIELAEGVVKAMSLHTMILRSVGLLVVTLATTGVLVLASDDLATSIESVAPKGRPGAKPEPKEGAGAVATITPRPVTPVAPGGKRAGLLAARLAVTDHGVQSDCRVYSAGVEVENLSGHMATVHFDPQDLKLELLAADGQVIAEGPSVRSGPAPTAHDATIPPCGYVGLSTYRGGIGLTPGSTLFAAGFQDWTLKPGTYRLRGTVAVAVKFGDNVLDPLKPEVPPARREDGKVSLELVERQFELSGR